MAGQQRDDFSSNTKEILAKRVSFCCSNPKCGRITSGPHSDKNKCINIGVAAHIKAAAPGGKRYDPKMTRQERRDISNGIWLCQSCSKLIDSDEIKYTVGLLQQWKRSAEEKTAQKLAAQISQESTVYKGNDDRADSGVVLDMLDKLIEQMPRLELDLRIIKYKIKENDYAGALDEISQIRWGSVEVEEIWIWLNYVSKNYEVVISSLNTINKTTIFINKIIGRTYMMLKDYDKALEVFLQINEGDRSYGDYYLLLRCYEIKANRDEERKILEKLEEYPENKDLTYYEWGCFYMYSRKSINLFSEAIKYNREFSEAYLERGKVERYYGNWERAIADLEHYLEKSSDHENVQVLMELAMAYYNKGEHENIYFTRWIDRLLTTNPDIALIDGKSIFVCDIGFDYSNQMYLTKNGDYIDVSVNQVKVMKIPCKSRALSGIGVYPSQVNEFLLRCGSDMSEEEIKEKASLPALYRIFQSNDEYECVKNNLLLENVLHLNHLSDEYEEYIIDNEDISVDIIKRLKSINAVIKIGNYIIDEWIPEASEAAQAFLTKLSQETMCDEAVIMLVGPKQKCQLTFNKKKIVVRYK